MSLSFAHDLCVEVAFFMTIVVEELWNMPEPALIGACHSSRRRFVEQRFARDTQRARLDGDHEREGG
jgi:hypothetical protein